METEAQTINSTPPREPWNKGKYHRPEAAVAAETCLVDPYQTADGRADVRFGMFNLAIDSKLRGCDVVALRVEDVAPSGYSSIARPCGRRKPVGQSGLS